MLNIFKEGHLLNLMPNSITILIISYLWVKAFDMASGLLKTLKNPKTYESRIMRDGIIRWIAELIAITILLGIDWVLGLEYYLSILVLSLFIYKELGSILENLKECGVQLPKQVNDVIENLNPDKEDKHQ